MVDRFLSVYDLHDEVPSLSVATWRRIMDRGEIVITTLGKRHFVSESDLRRYLDRQRTPGEVGA